MKRLFILRLVLLTAVVIPLSAAPIAFVTDLSGPAEEPPNSSPGTGFAVVTIDPAEHTLRVRTAFEDLLGLTTVSHIHVINGPGDTEVLDTVGPVATTTPSFPGFPAGVTGDSYARTFNTLDAGTYRPGFLTDSAALHPGLVDVEAAELELFNAITSGRAYLNIHTGPNPPITETGFPAGEIRGFLEPVPEPSTFSLGAAAIAGLVLLRARRSSH